MFYTFPEVKLSLKKTLKKYWHRKSKRIPSEEQRNVTFYSKHMKTLNDQKIYLMGDYQNVKSE